MSTSKASTQRNLFEGGFSNAEAVVIDDDDDDATKKKSGEKRPTTSMNQSNKKNKATPFSPAKTTKPSTIVTPDKKNPPHVPKYIHKTLDYKRKSESNTTLSDLTKSVFTWIEENCEIPHDFETNRSYGPWSGSCYEERVIRAYRLGRLVTKSKEEMCTECGTLGHDCDACPELV